MDTRSVLLGGALQAVVTVVALRFGAPSLFVFGSLGIGGVVVALATSSYHKEIVEGVAAGGAGGFGLLGVASVRPALLSPAGVAGCSTSAKTMTEPIAVLGGCWPSWLFLTLLGSIGIPVLAALNGGTAMLAAPHRERLRAVIPGLS